jgi:protein transport protein SEC23
VEVLEDQSTIEYISSSVEKTPNIFLFVVDTCIPQEELDSVKDSLQMSLNIMPPDTLVGLITFGKFAFVHELGFTECPKSYAFKASKEYTTAMVHQILGVGINKEIRGDLPENGIGRFLMPVSECDLQLNSILDDLEPDPWHVLQDERNSRCTGTALNLAISLLETVPKMGSRIMALLGGPCTIGPG